MGVRHAISKCALLATIAFVSVAVSGAQTDKASAAVNDMFSALGGKSFLGAQGFKASGTFFEFNHERLSNTDVFTAYVKFPDKERTETGTYRLKPTQINNAEAGWSVYDKKVDAQSAADAKEFLTSFKTGFQYLARFVLSRPELTLQYVDSELVDFKRNDVIEFRDSGNLFQLFIDAQTHLPTKMEVRRSGETFVREEQFANWHDFQGIRTSLFITHFKDGEKTSEVRYDNVSYNSDLADSLFVPPTPTAR
jgi:hypothetical protein